MKNPILPCIIFLFVLICCQADPKDINRDPFLVTVDTINIHLKDSAGSAVRVSLTHAIKYKDHYYAFLDNRGVYFSPSHHKLLYAISEQGDMRSIPIPVEDLTSDYFDFFVKNDSIIFKNYISRDSYHLDHLTLQWTQIPEADDVVYEDDRYYIISLDYGEFGFFTWFRDKTTEQEYELGAFVTRVNKVDSSYYLTDTYYILRVDDPTQLVPTIPERSYSFAKNEKHLYENYTQLQGAEIFYIDSIYAYNVQTWKRDKGTPKVAILTSFVHNDSLFYLCQDSVSMYVARLDSGGLMPVQHISKALEVFNYNNSYRMSIRDDGSQLLKFNTENPNLFGLIGIHGNKLDIRYLQHDVDSIPYLGKDAYPTIISHYHNHPDSLHLKTLCRIEEENGAIKLRGFFNLNNSPQYYNRKLFTEFIRTQDADFSCISKYHYMTEDSIVCSVSLTWTETRPYKLQRERYRHNDPIQKQLFQNKVNELTQYLTDNLNSKPKVKKEKAYHTYYTLSWESEQGMKAVLRYSDDFIMNSEIELVMRY